MYQTKCCNDAPVHFRVRKKPGVPLLLIVLFSAVSITGWSQNVTLKGNKMSMRSVFTEIKKQTGYTFFYNPDLLDKAKKVTIDVREKPFQEVLDQLFMDQPFTYSIVGKLITLSKKVEPPPLPKFLVTPNMKISGQVHNKLNQPLEGASVMILHTNRGTLTDDKGAFTLGKLKPTDTLVFSMIGYKALQMEAPSDGELSVTLKDAVDKLDEVLKTAYGRTSRRLSTGDITKVTAEEIERQPVMNPVMALQGKVPGLQITPISGFASSPVKVELRGRSDLNPASTADPLYIVDGVPITVLDISGNSSYAWGSPGFNQGVAGFTNGQSPLFSINPKDIESIEVLKDAGATAIYGSRGAKGVILITTKKGKAGPAQFNLHLQQGISKITRYWDMLSTHQYLQMRREAFKNDAITPSVLNAPDLLLWDTTRYTDWQRAIYGGTGKFTDVSMSLSGGSAQAIFSLRAGYSRTTDITASTGSTQRATVNTSNTYRSPNNKLEVTLSSNFTYADVNVVGFPASAVSTLPPNAPPIYSRSGGLNWDEWNKGMSPIFPLISYPFGVLKQTSPQKTNDLNTNLLFKYRIFSKLVFTSSFGYNNSHNNANLFTPISAQNPLLNPTGTAYFSTTDNANWIIEPRLDYTMLIGYGKLSILTGATFQSTETHLKKQTGTGYTNDYLLGTISTAPLSKSESADGFKKYAGVFANINYNLYNRYILDLSARRDGSSRFGPGRQFGNFGSVAVAWIGSEEKWLKNMLPSWMNYLKLRGSYGITGSDGVNGDYQYISQWSSLGVYNSILPTYDGVSPLVSIHAVNPLYQWQNNQKLEGALELGLLSDNRINLTIAYYRERTGNQLVPYPTPLLTGFGSVTANSPALVQNAGWEGTLRATIVQTQNFTWSADFNISINRNKLLAFPNLDQSPYASLYKLGAPTAVSFAFHYKGVDPLTGKYTYQDLNHDGKITTDASVAPGTLDDDRGTIIDYAPKYMGGFGTQLNYKGIQLNLFFNYTRQIGYNGLLTSNAGSIGNVSSELFKGRWKNPGDRATYARLTTAPGAADYLFASSDGVITDASYLRLNTLSVGYDLSRSIIKKMGVKGCTVSLLAQNVFIITGFKGPDPTVSAFGSMPLARLITGNLNFNF